MLKDIVAELERLEAKAGEEGWGGEFREELFDILIQYFQYGKGRKSAGGLLCHLVTSCRQWFSDTALAERERGSDQ